LNKITDKECKLQFERLFNDESKPLGLLINERLSNVPPQLAPQLHKMLFDEIHSNSEREKSMKLPLSFNFENYLLFSTTYHQPLNPEKSQHVPSMILTKSKSKSKSQSKPSDELIYQYPEEQFYLKESPLKYRWRVMRYEIPTRWTLRGNLAQTRSILCFPHSSIPKVMSEMNECLST